MTDPDAATSSFGLKEIGQIAVTVQNLSAATAFYRDKLGMTLLFEAPSMAFFQCGSMRLMLSTAEKPEFDHAASILYYRVDDIAAAHRTLEQRGVTFVADPHVVHKTPGMELWMAFFRDCENNMLALMCERKFA